MENIYFKELPAIIVASHRAIIPSYYHLGRMCVEVIGPEMARLGCECTQPGYIYRILSTRPDVEIESGLYSLLKE